ncbi:MAG TPA: hypothetical protein VJ742_09920, partial [Nitrososphaera sp.]|nr:hypothetical protein [Nitrososphaera sp.]
MPFGKARSLLRRPSAPKGQPRPLAERVAMIRSEALKQRTLSAVEKELTKTDATLRKKKIEQGDIRLSLLTTFNPSLRALRQERLQKVSLEIKALEEKKKALRVERPLAKQADAVKKELGITETTAKK